MATLTKGFLSLPPELVRMVVQELAQKPVRYDVRVLDFSNGPYMTRDLHMDGTVSPEANRDNLRGLLSLCLTSKSLQLIARDVLYETVNLWRRKQRTNETHDDGNARAYLCLDDLALLLRSLYENLELRTKVKHLICLISVKSRPCQRYHGFALCRKLIAEKQAQEHSWRTYLCGHSKGDPIRGQATAIEKWLTGEETCVFHDTFPVDCELAFSALLGLVYPSIQSLHIHFPVKLDGTYDNLNFLMRNTKWKFKQLRHLYILPDDDSFYNNRYRGRSLYPYTFPCVHPLVFTEILRSPRLESIHYTCAKSWGTGRTTLPPTLKSLKFDRRCRIQVKYLRTILSMPNLEDLSLELDLHARHFHSPVTGDDDTGSPESLLNERSIYMELSRPQATVKLKTLALHFAAPLHRSCRSNTNMHLRLGERLPCHVESLAQLEELDTDLFYLVGTARTTLHDVELHEFLPESLVTLRICEVLWQTGSRKLNKIKYTRGRYDMLYRFSQAVRERCPHFRRFTWVTRGVRPGIVSMQAVRGPVTDPTDLRRLEDDFSGAGIEFRVDSYALEPLESKPLPPYIEGEGQGKTLGMKWYYHTSSW